MLVTRAMAVRLVANGLIPDGKHVTGYEDARLKEIVLEMRAAYDKLEALRAELLENAKTEDIVNAALSRYADVEYGS